MNCVFCDRPFPDKWSGRGLKGRSLKGKGLCFDCARDIIICGAPFFDRAAEEEEESQELTLLVLSNRFDALQRRIDRLEAKATIRTAVDRIEPREE